ncbi:MAG: Brp/Blh family beta-carotene 15,15'-dioxygenase [Flavobacteriaceae bacterium]
MKIIYRFSIVSSFLGLWITSLLPESFELTLGFLLIFTFGMIHGSNDILIISQIKKYSNYNFYKVLLTYLTIVSLAVFIFYFIPVLALILFVCFSAYHFGEQHWEHLLSKMNNNLKNIFFFCYGLLILYLIFFFNQSGVIDIIYEITGIELLTIYCNEIITSVFLILSTILIYACYSKSLNIKSILKEFFSIIILAVIFNSSSLIWGFSIYFILWHSIPSLLDQISFIYGDLKKINIIKYIKNAFPYWLVSIIGIIILFYIFKDEKHFYSLFFAFIAAVTFPHAIVMMSMFTKKSNK